MKKISIMRDMVIEKMEQVYYTRDYDKFKILSDNRTIKILDDIVRSIEEKGILEPITVNEYMQILDGQHRFTVAKGLNMSIPFKVVSGLKLSDILDTKATTKNWTPKDYIEYYCKNKNNNYVVLKNLLAEENLPVNTMVSMYHFGRKIAHSTEIKRILREGTLDMYKSKEYGDKVLGDYREVIHLIKDKTAAMKGAVISIITSDKYNHDRMISQLNKCGATVLFSSKSLRRSQCLIKLEELYNFKKRERIVFDLI
ncbi:MAG: ParB N-terminal domain-containing protein [Fusobacteriaceae bacterium]